MALKQSLKQSLSMTMTPQLQQAIKILQMSMMELQQEVNNALVENPTLEEGEFEEEERLRDQGPDEQEAKSKKEKEQADPVEEMKEEFDWEEYLQNFANSKTTSKASKSSGVDLPNFDQIISKPKTLADHLYAQLRMASNDPRSLEIGEEIIGNLNEDGYLVILVEELIEQLKSSKEEIESVLQTVQHFDPPGVAARDLKECLLLQCENLIDREDCEFIINNHLPELENKNYVVIAKALALPIESTIKLCQRVHSLEPKPGRSFHTAAPMYITPDVYVLVDNDDFIVAMNDESVPKVKVSKMYQEQVEKKEVSGDTRKYIKEKLKDAAWLLRSINQRQRTIFRVSQSIVERQKDFFIEGPKSLKPMVLRDIADELGLHESTISRVTNNKYMHTPHGIYELKYFFNSALTRRDGTDVASESVKQKIQELVSSEDTKKPLSDQQLSKILKEQNINIARRTVAKYREALGILPSSKRKKYF